MRWKGGTPDLQRDLDVVFDMCTPPRRPGDPPAFCRECGQHSDWRLRRSTMTANKGSDWECGGCGSLAPWPVPELVHDHARRVPCQPPCPAWSERPAQWEKLSSQEGK